MTNCNEITLEFKKYLKKLIYILDNDIILSLGKKKLVKKSIIDDVICCLDASWPEIYKNYLTKRGPTRLQSPKNYNKMNLAIKKKFMFSTNIYQVNYAMAILAINDLMNSIDDDIKHILNVNSQS